MYGPLKAVNRGGLTVKENGFNVEPAKRISEEFIDDTKAIALPISKILSKSICKIGSLWNRSGCPTDVRACLCILLSIHPLNQSRCSQPCFRSCLRPHRRSTVHWCNQVFFFRVSDVGKNVIE